MKTHTISLYFLITVYILTSCSEEAKDYYSVLGTINIANDSVIIDSDNNSRLLIENPGSVGNSVRDKDRVIANFTIVDKPLPKSINYIINIYYLEKVLFKPVIELTSQNADSIGNDPVTINKIWLSKDFLNLDFTFYGGETKHLINLIKYPEEICKDTINIEIRHNKNSDNGPYNYSGLVSFDLKTLRKDAADSIVLHVKAQEFEDNIYEKYFTYKY